MKRRKAELEKQEVRKKCWLPVQDCKLARGMCWLQVAPYQLPKPRHLMAIDDIHRVCLVTTLFNVELKLLWVELLLGLV